MSRILPALLALLAGALFALGGSPHDYWWNTVFGFALLSSVINERPWKQRFCLGWLAGIVLFLVSLAWQQQFSVGGYLLLSAFQACFVGLAAVLIGTRPRWRLLAVPAAFTLVEVLRWRVPFGGFPMGGLTTGQASGPLLPAAGLVGELGMITLTALLGAALANWRNWRNLLAVLAPVALVVAGLMLPQRLERPVEVAVVQGGGPQALLREQQDPDAVFERHYRLTEPLANTGLALIVWPENVIAVRGDLAGTEEDQRMSKLSLDTGATIVAGVVESSPGRFRNSAVAWDNGRITGRYEKVQRVPFGEYVPGRQFVERIADLSQVPSDAIPGRGPAVVPSQVGPVGVSISYEGLFARRGREAVNDGGRLLVIPTNAASYRSSHVAETQVQSARMRAVETGRYVLQASPTGISAVVDPDGIVVEQTEIGPGDVMLHRVWTSTSRTPYAVYGDWPLIALSAIALLTQVGRPVRPSRAGSKSSS